MKENVKPVMEKWQCTACDYVYEQVKGDPDHGVVAGTSFGSIPDSWVCPECGASKDQFVQI